MTDYLQEFKIVPKELTRDMYNRFERLIRESDSIPTLPEVWEALTEGFEVVSKEEKK